MAVQTIEDMFNDEVDVNRLQPSRTFFLNREAKSLAGEIDGIEAVRQAVELQLDTMRFGYEIFNASYGSEMELLIGKSFEFVKTELRRVVYEACTKDERVLQVTVTEIDRLSVDSLQFSVDVTSIFGEFSVEGVELLYGSRG